MSNSNDKSLLDRVFLKRVTLFFGNAVGNAAAAMITAVVASSIMISAEVKVFSLFLWLSILVLLVGVVLIIESRFDEDDLTSENARLWLTVRVISGCLVSLMYSSSVYLFPAGVETHFVMYIVMILVTIVSLCATGFAVMPIYTYLVSLVTAIPMLIFLLINASLFNITLVFSMVIIWGVLVNKARFMANSAIEALITNERLIEEIHDHEQTRQQLDHMANHDYLTGLPNRKYLIELIDRLLARRIASDEHFIVMFLDLDGFKKVNDQRGHAMGGCVLIHVAKILKNTLSANQTVARIGGDEFIVVLQNQNDAHSDESITKLSQTIQSNISKPIMMAGQDDVIIGVSVGVIHVNNSHLTADAIIQQADEAMYQNKERNRENQT